MQTFLQYYISAASKLNVGGMPDEEEEEEILRLLVNLTSYSVCALFPCQQY